MNRVVRFAALLVLLFAFWFGYVLYKIDAVERMAEPKKADVAIVLGASVWGDQPSPGLRERLDLALSLYQEGYVPFLLVSGGLGEGKKVEEAVVMKNYLMEKGVPEDSIIVENKARSTYENLAFSQKLMEDYGFKTALVVSHGYHLARAVDMAKELGMDVHPVGAKSNVLYTPYYKAREVFAYTKWILSEYLPMEKPE
ncbi:YdcF family protein [Brevibacillus sp. SYP-B805]|uniref:YdcF family protein n=1 Tax=Brevibacillus sp. SYP-B805 TaxID=1578199 RepID=UPI0013EAF178|nr:YdcF family protein [Brevibacillus sp. SYP-B805]NGQ94818.1 YdcF family protein [Brevibacillus sp. SYP-B805]